MVTSDTKLAKASPPIVVGLFAGLINLTPDRTSGLQPGDIYAKDGARIVIIEATCQSSRDNAAMSVQARFVQQIANSTAHPVTIEIVTEDNRDQCIVVYRTGPRVISSRPATEAEAHAYHRLLNAWLK